MHALQLEIMKPTDDSAFEDMCARIYGEVFGDPTPKVNGRRGQAQGGVDVFVNTSAGRVGIQSKRYVDGALTLKTVEKELERAEKKRVPIVRLIVATTAAADSTLLHNVQTLSDQRVAAGKFSVDVEFWDDICRHIRGSGRLQRDYAPNAPGAMFHEQRESNAAFQAALLRIESALDVISGLREPPKHMRRTPIAKCLNSPLPLPPSTGPVANRAGPVEPPEIAPVLELTKGWLAQAKAIGAVPPRSEYVRSDVTVGFGVRPAGVDAPVATVAKNATVWFNATLPSIEDGLVLRFSCHINEARWVGLVERGRGCWKVDSHLEPVSNGCLAETSRPGLYEEALAWAHLLSDLKSGSELVGYFSLRAEPQAGPFGDPKFHPAPFKIDMTRLPEDWIRRSLWRVRRILLALELARVTGAALGGPLHWIFTPELFDERIGDKVLKDAAPFLKQAVEQGTSPWEHQLAEIEGVPRVLRYVQGDVIVRSGFSYRKSHRA